MPSGSLAPSGSASTLDAISFPFFNTEEIGSDDDLIIG